MEEQRILKRKNKLLIGSNRKQLAEICQELGDFYNGKKKYELALKEYKHSARVYKEIGLKIENARCNRMVGEMYMFQAEFEKALKYEDIYLSIARELDNKLEEQRALATLGRIYLLQGQSVDDKEISKNALKAAEKAFVKSLVLCESLKGKINNNEFMDMRARLLLNIGVVLEHLDVFDRALNFLHKAITICKSQDLFDLLNQCYITEGLLYSQKHNDNAKALTCFNLALEIASRLENKVAKQCEALSLKAGALCKMSDYHSAKIILLKAWKMKTPDEQEREDIERKLKTVAAICYSEDLLLTTDSNEHSSLKTLYERLGDGACFLKNYKKAIDYYNKMLEHAEKSGSTGKELIPIYVSLYQTYKDMELYDKALEFHKKEYELIKDIPSEACLTLLNIAEVYNLSDGHQQDTENTYIEALSQARKENNIKHEVKTMRLLLNFYKEYLNLEKEAKLEDEMSLIMKSNNFIDSSDDEQELSQNTPNIGDDICIENLTDVSDGEENFEVQKTRKRGKGFTIKKNSKGETQLHQACISGNSLLVTRLLAQGHPVNIRDNAGWLPLHEACIHGHKDVVDTLIKNGAYINDRGGTQCDGITPLYDAASNGHLEIVNLLLDSGASPALKTDQGETAYDILRKWRKDASVEATEHIFYETLCSRMRKNSPKASDKRISANNKTIALSKRKQNSKESDTNTFTLRRNLERSNTFSSDSNTLSDNKYRSYQESDTFDNKNMDLKRGMAKNRNMVDDDSSNSSIEINNLITFSGNYNDNGVKQYKSVMKGLRSRKTISESNSDQEGYKENEKRKKGALLGPDEVGEDWLDDDMADGNKRKKPRSFDFVNNRKSDENDKRDSTKSIDTSINASSYSNNLLLNDSVIENYESREILNSPNFPDSDSEIMHQENVPPSNYAECNIRSLQSNIGTLKSNEQILSGNKSGKNFKKWKRQSLLKVGFSKERISKSKVHSTSIDSCGSDSEGGSTLSMSSYRSNKANEFSEEPDSTTEQNSLFGSYNKPSNISQRGAENIHVDFKNATLNYTQPTQASQAPASVRVRVQDKLLLIPVMLQSVDSLAISWLAKEVSRRYYNIEGVQPSLNLLTSDGAILADEDPLSLVIGSSELKASITSWNLPPLGERYIECCSQFKTRIDNYVRNMMEASQATHKLELSNLNLSFCETQPVFKALNHQSNLTHILLANNLLGNEGIKHLANCLPSLTQLKHLNLSGNTIDAEGVKNLLFVMEKQNWNINKNLIDLDLSFNCLGNVGFNHLVKLTKYISFKSLNLNCCDINAKNIDCEIDLSNLESIDLGFNDFNESVLKIVLGSLNPNVCTSIKVCGCKNLSGEMIADLFDNNLFIKLKYLDLSRCEFTDTDVAQILRSASKCEELDQINVGYNKQLTIISLKKLIQYSPSFTDIDLEGCVNIFKYYQESDLQNNWFLENSECKVTHLKISSRDSMEDKQKLQMLSTMWMNYHRDKAAINLDLYNLLHLSVLS